MHDLSVLRFEYRTMWSTEFEDDALLMTLPSIGVICGLRYSSENFARYPNSMSEET
jgi:hypothetical protein